MILPTQNPRNFVMEIRETLLRSMQQREKDVMNWRALFYAGATIDQDAPAIANIITSRIRTQAGNLFSPDNLTFRLEFDPNFPIEILQWASAIGSDLSRKLRAADADLEFGDAVEAALIDGSCFGQLDWDGEQFACDTIMHPAVGVLNERAKGLHEAGQDAILVRYAMPIEALKVWLRKFKRAENVADVFDSKQQDAARDWNEMGESTRVVLGLNQPIGSASPSQAGFVNLLPRMPHVPSAGMAGREVTIDAIWLKDTKRDDWATVYVIDGNETIGTDIWRNCLGVKGCHPYFLINPFPVKGNIFGHSMVAFLAEQQNFLRKHSAGMDHIMDMREDPAHVGFSAIQTSETYRQALRSPGGWVTETGPGAKVQPFAPEFPSELIPALELVANYASDAANQPPVSQGRGESGVRAGAHAETLLTAASARERRPAHRTVRQCGDMGHLALEILKVKCAEELPGNITFDTLPEGYHVLCNGYTASPLFAMEHRAILNDMLRAGAIGPEEYLHGLNPQGLDMMLAALKNREQQQAELVRSLPPEERVKLIAKGGRKR